MSNNLQQAIFMQKDRESKQYSARNEQQQCERQQAKAMASLPSSSRSKQWPLREREAARNKQYEREAKRKRE
jgi:hypothetical protein